MDGIVTATTTLGQSRPEINHEGVLSRWFGFFIQWHINFYVLFNIEAILVEGQ